MAAENPADPQPITHKSNGPLPGSDILPSPRKWYFLSGWNSTISNHLFPEIGNNGLDARKPVYLRDMYDGIAPMDER
jgi:hypothetical protein